MSCYDETFLSESEGPEGLVHEEELQRPRTADGEGEERPFTQAGFREEDLAVSMSHRVSDAFNELRIASSARWKFRTSPNKFIQTICSAITRNSRATVVLCSLLVETPPQPLCEPV